MTIKKWLEFTNIENPMFLIISYIIAKFETNFKNNLVGGVGELGYFQITPRWFPNIKKGLDIENQLNVLKDIIDGIIKQLVNKGIETSLENIIRVYNGGLNNMYNKTTDLYIKKVKSLKII